MVWAGAKRPLWIFEKGKTELTEYKGDKFPIGSTQFQEKIFTEKEILLKEGDTIYSFTDGYSDQFGEQGKFMIRKFRSFLEEIHLKNFTEQENLLKTTFETWKGEHKQTDDVLVVGLKV